MATLWETSAGVNSLSLEDPWLAAALTDGTVALLNTDNAMRQRPQGRAASQAAATKRLFQLPSGAAGCADLADQWLVAGSGKSVCRSCVLMLATAFVLTLHFGQDRWLVVQPSILIATACLFLQQLHQTRKKYGM